MKKIAALVFAFLLMPVYLYAADVVTSKISEVKLFSDRALVKKTASAKISKGTVVLNIGLDAFNVDRDSISASVFGDGEVVSVQLKEIELTDMPQPKIKEAENKLRAAKEAKSALVNRQTALSKKEAFLDSITKFSDEQVSKDLKTSFPRIDELSGMMSFLETNYTQVNKDKEALDKNVIDADKEIDKLERELQDLRYYEKKSNKLVEIVFNSKKDQTVNIEASYIAFNASWFPVYRADIALDEGKLSLVMFADLTQKTGEDWAGVKFTVSNAIPFTGAKLPSPGSWYIDVPVRVRDKETGTFAYKAVLRAEMPLRKKAINDWSMDAANAPIEQLEEAKFVVAEHSETPLSFEYTLPQPVTVESGGKETMLPISSKDMKSEFFLYTAPKLNPAAFLVARASSDRELLGGPLNVYFGGQFIGKSILAQKKPGESFDIPLGEDRQVIAKREKVRDKIDETFFGKVDRLTVVRNMAFKITLENMKNKPVTIVVVDPVPVSRTDKIAVKDLKMDPEPTQRNYLEKEGVMMWKLELAPNQTKEIKTEFILTYPREGISGIST